MIVSAAEAKDMSVCITTTGEIGFPFKYILEIDGMYHLCMHTV